MAADENWEAEDNKDSECYVQPLCVDEAMGWGWRGMRVCEIQCVQFSQPFLGLPRFPRYMGQYLDIPVKVTVSAAWNPGLS